MTLPALWPHQQTGIDAVLAHIAGGVKRIILCSPTGGGKSRMVAELIRKFSESDKRTVLYTNRRMLVEQLTKSLRGFGIPVGVRAAGHADNRDLPVQVSSIQTEESRVYKRQGYLKWELHPADVVFVDEAHIQTGEVARKVMADHLKAGAVVVLVTATPLDMGDLADVIVQAGTNSQLRDCGALVQAIHYGPDEPDLRFIGRTELNKGDDLTEKQQKKLMGGVEGDEPTPKLQQLFGRVMEWFDKLNPDRKPSILFASGVPESRWFAQEFTKRGIAAAHIDGNDIWTHGSGDVAASREAREELLEMSKDGTVKVICNRFVLREGIDCPWLAHGIFATPFGSLQSYLQSGGRLLRAHDSMEHVTIQDHGGNWWRHGSLNADRTFPLGCSSRVLAGVREDGLREKKAKEPMRCPRCAAIMVSLKCVCGFLLDPKAKSRPVVQENGKLIQMEGDIFRPRVTKMEPDTQKLWDKAYYRARNGDMTFRQAIGLFYQDNGYWPPLDLVRMPKDTAGRYQKVKDVLKEQLIDKPKSEAA